jgi:hypothetical protein
MLHQRDSNKGHLVKRTGRSTRKDDYKRHGKQGQTSIVSLMGEIIVNSRAHFLLDGIETPEWRVWDEIASSAVHSRDGPCIPAALAKLCERGYGADNLGG